MPAAEFWADRTMTVASVRKLIEGLDPVEHDTEITHLSLEVVVPPFFAELAVNAGTARGMVHPAEAAVGYRKGTGDGIVRPVHRSVDTMAFFGLFLREGYRGERAQQIFDRVQQIHHDTRGLHNDLQLHVLGLLVGEADRLVAAIGHKDFFTEKERTARYNFWRGVGTGMGLRDIPGSYAEIMAWVDEFEAEHLKYSEAAHLIFKNQVKLVERYFPGPTKFLAGQAFIAACSDRTRTAVGARRILPGAVAPMTAAFAAMRASERVRRVNLSNSWVRSFSRLGDEPDIHRLGYQHDPANDKRYLNAGDSSDGYTYTVADGLQSAR